jgi:hypothetical protein
LDDIEGGGETSSIALNGRNVPSMSYDNIVKGRVSAPKSGETDFDDHG